MNPTQKHNFKIPIAYLQTFKPMRAVCLAYLTELASASKSEWFGCSSKNLKDHLNLSRHQQEKVTQGLVELKILEIKMMGYPARRRMRLDIDVVVKLIEEAKASSVLENKEALFIFPRPKGLLKKINKVLGSKDSVSKVGIDNTNGVFFGSEVSEADMIFKEMSKKLHETLKLKNMIKRQPTMSQWCRQIKELHTKDKVPTKDITDVMNWYLKNCGKRYVPRVCSASAFRKRFDDLYDKASNDLEASDTPVQVSKRASDICARLCKRSWPAKAEAQMPEVIQTSLETVDELFCRLKNFISNYDESKHRQSKRLYSFACHVNSVVGSPDYFVESQFNQLFNDVKDWKDWSGNLKSSTITLDSKLLRLYGARLGKQWDQNSTLWNDLIEHIYEN